MIKEKITPELKKLFRDTIKKTMDTGLEHGFLLCSDRIGNLTAANVCKGETCKVELPNGCPIETQGNFHTHPILGFFTKDVEKPLRLSKKDMLLVIKDMNKTRKDKYDPISPSRSDALQSLFDKCRNDSNGTVCIGNDLGEKIECWTAKELHRKDCVRAFKELVTLPPEERTEQPEQWTKDLFNIETIDVKRTFIESLLGK